MNRLGWHLGIERIAAAAGKHIQAVQRDRRLGRFDIDDLVSVSAYVSSHQLQRLGHVQAKAETEGGVS